MYFIYYMESEITWEIISKYFHDNPYNLVTHHVESFNQFFKKGIFQVFKEKNPIEIFTLYDANIEDYRSKCIMYFGGKDGNKIYFGKPIVYDSDDNIHYMYPNEARLRNMTYGMTIHYDIDIEFINVLDEGEEPELVTKNVGGAKGKIDLSELTAAEMAKMKEDTEASIISKNIQKRDITLEKIYLGKFPIMLHSDFCILKNLPKELRFEMGECRNDIGGYFIIDGKEKTIISQEKFGNNMIYIRDFRDEEEEEDEKKESKYLCSAEIKSISENVSKPRRSMGVKIMAPGSSGGFGNKTYSNKNIVVSLPNVRQPIPLFILFRALGIVSDKKIIQTCLLDLEKNSSYIDLFIPSVHDGHFIYNQQDALFYIGRLTKGKTIQHAQEILADFFLPHIGETNFIEKGFFLGHMVFELLKVYVKIDLPTDRDHFKYKRIDTVGNLMYDLFRDYFSIQQRAVQKGFESIAYFSKNIYAKNLLGLILKAHPKILKHRLVEEGFKRAMKGDWGAYTHTKKVGIVQDLNRLSFNSMISHLRKTNLPIDSSLKVVAPRLLHGSQYGFTDPVDTPDGGNIGIHKYLSISTYICESYSRNDIIDWMKEKIALRSINDFPSEMLLKLIKVFVNGYWCGVIENPIENVEKMKLFRRNGLIPIYTSISFNIRKKTVEIFTDAGRLCRPIFYYNNKEKKMSYENEEFQELLTNGKLNWTQMVSGYNDKIKSFDKNENKIYELNELYEGLEETNPARLERFIKKQAIIDYIDSSESEHSLIATDSNLLNTDGKQFTHQEIHPSLMFGVMGNQVIFPENNQFPRDLFSCGQSKQACSIYHTNYLNRLDKTGIVLNYGQTPLVKSRYTEYINNEEMPYGENTIVAIMCYTGYNVEDAVLINEGAIERGLFNTTYYTTYETHEEKEKVSDKVVNKVFTNIENSENVLNLKRGYDYSKLDKFGLIKEETKIDEKTILIGMAMEDPTKPNIKADMSKGTKKGQEGIVDKSFLTDGEEGTRIAKVRVREVRIPAMGDKMASRAGQKGTVGLVIPEENMPFTKDGLKPDLIINPHAIPTRMTIGQLVECITGKLSANIGSYGDCTAFINEGSKIKVFGEMLTKVGYHSSGNEILYNGMTGEQLESEVFIGPNYYMRLKHMVKDKINSRAGGPKNNLTKQAVGGRANDGGLRIGEMERDGLISHGMNEFLRESMVDRGDKYYIAVCNSTGVMCICNPDKNLYLSPMIDGPIKFIESADGNNLHLDSITKFGRSFSIISVPYTFKLLMQELQTINIQMRIITDENIEQIENMTNSVNIEMLLKEKKTSKEIIKEIENILKNKVSQVKTKVETPIEDTPSNESDIYNPLSSSESLPSNFPGTPSGSPPNKNENTVKQDYFSPKTPPDTPPDESMINSLKSNQSSESYHPITPTPSPESILQKYEVGNEVVYLSDAKRDRIWKITKIAEPFLHIETDDVDNLNISDTVQIVTVNDIQKKDDFIMNANMDTLPLTPEIPYDQNGGNNNVPNINFAPVFKIMNGGNDFSKSETEGGENNEFMVNNNGTSSEIIPNIPTISNGGNSSPKVDSTSNNINFSGIKIKKIE